ncbi:MAG: DEAD/DEAH box helicase [Polyangiales bacterium]
MGAGNAPEGFTGGRRRPWEKGRGLASVLSHWESSGLVRNVTLEEQLEGDEGSFAAVPAALHPGVRDALFARGVDKLYAHQARAFELAASGRDFVVATPTASGKSLCYNLPVLDAMAREPSARALYLFPTKALSRDQEEALRATLREAGLSQGAITYDGDTPGDARRAAREKSGVILTNPDMLHAGILPHHASWARFFANLRYVVIDELHTYRGVFGSHLANVLRRLDRIARFHGAKPVYLMASATIGNPEEHASRMIGRDVALVGENGAPRGPRRVVVYNPPVVNAELGVRASYLKTAVRLTCDLVRAEVPTLVFGQSRNGVETMLKYLRDKLEKDHIDPNAIQAYRGGYLPETRRRIEAGLRNGDIRCVVSTNALELGIDIGSLDAVVCAGYPGTMAALWQRFGRAGRRKGESLAVLVASSAPLDQYVALGPEIVLRAPIEEARIDPDNVEILLSHLKCASFELPFDEGDRFGDLAPEALADALAFLAENRVVQAVPGPHGRRVYHWASDAYPANSVSLRSVGWDNFVIIDLDGNRTIAEMDFRSTHTMLHEQAIYQHEGEQYQVERLDFENHKAFIRKVEPDYYTTAMTHTKVTVLHVDESTDVSLGGAVIQAGLGEVSVIEKVVGYKKIKFHTHENVGYGDVHLPELQKHTSSFWLTFPEDFVQSRREPRAVVIDALRALSRAMHTIGAVGLMVDPHDLGRTLGDRSDPDLPPQKGEGPGFDPTIFLYDQVPGGIGLAPRLFDEREALLRRSRALIEACPCEDGCPACIGPEAGGEPGAGGEAHLDGRKARVLSILTAIGVAGIH